MFRIVLLMGGTLCVLAGAQAPKGALDNPVDDESANPYLKCLQPSYWDLRMDEVKLDRLGFLELRATLTNYSPETVAIWRRSFEENLSLSYRLWKKDVNGYYTRSRNPAVRVDWLRPDWHVLGPGQSVSIKRSVSRTAVHRTVVLELVLADQHWTLQKDRLFPTELPPGEYVVDAYPTLRLYKPVGEAWRSSLGEVRIFPSNRLWITVE